MEFETGSVFMTLGLSNKAKEDPKNHEEIMTAFERYIDCDWGDLGEEDKEMNDNAIKNNDDRILARYNLSFGSIYIITEYDRSATHLLLVEEY